MLNPQVIRGGDGNINFRLASEPDFHEREVVPFLEKNLSDFPELQLPIDFARDFCGENIWKAETFSLCQSTRAFLGNLAATEGVNLSLLYLTAVKILLLRYNQSADVAIAALHDPQEPDLLLKADFSWQSKIVRTELDRAGSFKDGLRRVHRSVADAVSRRTGRQSEGQGKDIDVVPRVGYGFCKGSAATAGLKPDLLAKEKNLSDLLFLLCTTPDEIAGTLCFKASLFEARTIRRIIGHWQTLLAGISADPDLPLSQLPLLPEHERQTLLIEWNTPEVSYPVDRCLHELFEEQVGRCPGATAITFENKSITYADLDERGNRLAHYLIGSGIKPDDLVGLCLERGIEMIVGLLGILKAGGAYVPLDPNYPAERVSFMVADSQVKLVLTQANLASVVQGVNARLICLDLEAEEIGRSNPTRPESGAQSEHLAYVIYTSGSTGQPKGTLITHRCVARLFRSTGQWFNFNQDDVWTLFHSFAFDFSVWEIWGALLNGGRLLIVPYAVSRNPSDFLALLCAERVTVLNQTPSAFRQLVAAEALVDQSLALRYIILGGEALEFDSLKKWFARHSFERPLLVNMYGITETTVHATYLPLTRENFDRSLGSNIGVRLPDLRLYILDRDLELMPIGIAGEMFVGGPGLARGYLNRKELEEERFIANPFDRTSRVYKTGDLARFRPDGNIEYLGRLDDQVKIRGFRIEPGEIEAALNHHPLVRESVVLGQRDPSNEKHLAAYLVTTSSMTSADLRGFLGLHLPGYMVPTFYFRIERIPLTPNGKLDRQAVREMGKKIADSSSTPRPESDFETIVANVWCETLCLPSVDLNENFFDAGGDSVNITLLQSRLRAHFGDRVTIPILFEYPTIRSLVRFLASGGKADFMKSISDRATKQRVAMARRRKITE
jgi:amino acid adenylation domain-containing protein